MATLIPFSDGKPTILSLPYYDSRVVRLSASKASNLATTNVLRHWYENACSGSFSRPRVVHPVALASLLGLVEALIPEQRTWREPHGISVFEQGAGRA